MRKRLMENFGGCDNVQPETLTRLSARWTPNPTHEQVLYRIAIMRCAKQQAKRESFSYLGRPK